MIFSVSGRRFRVTVHTGTEINPVCVATFVINLVNLDGATHVGLQPHELVDPVVDALGTLDPERGWRSWIRRTFGRELTISGSGLETHRQRSALALRRVATLRPAVGVNLGGYYSRTASLASDGVYATGTEVRSPSGADSLLVGRDAVSFCRLIQTWVREAALTCDRVGIAWSAPRGARARIVAQSHTFSSLPQLVEPLESGELQQRLQDSLGVPVLFCNDGEAVAAAEYLGSSPPSSALCLKWGSSLACGVLENGEVLLHPLELAKCLLNPRSVPAGGTTPHPVTGMSNTVRGAIGAGAIATRYFGDAGAQNRYEAFVGDVVAGRPQARTELRNVMSSFVDAISIAFDIVGPREVILSGRGLSGEFGHIFMRGLAAEFDSRFGGEGLGRVKLSMLPPSYVAAIGAAYLAQT